MSAEQKAESRRPDDPGELIERHLPALRAFVRLRLGPQLRALESESDLVQSVCGDLVAELDHVEFASEAEFRSWLFTAALNKIRNRHRHHATAKRKAPNDGLLDLDDAALAAAYASVTSPSGQAMRREEAELLERAMESLPEDYRAVLTLAKIGGLPRADVARAMGRTVPSVRNLLSRAMVKLAAALSALEHQRSEGRDRAGS